MNHVRVRVLIALSMILIMVLANAGCLSVETVREALLFNPPEREVVYWKVTPPPVDVFWEANSMVPADTYSCTETFKVKEGARWLKVSYTIELPSTWIGEREILNYTIYFNPEVALRLRMPNSDIYWELNITEGDANTLPIMIPQSGIWTLRIEARGYGMEIGGVKSRDTVWVVVDLYEPK